MQGIEASAGMLAGLKPNELSVLLRLCADAKAGAIFWSAKDFGKKIKLGPQAVDKALDELQIRGIIRRWHSATLSAKVRKIEIVPTGATVDVGERRGSRKIVSRET